MTTRFKLKESLVIISFMCASFDSIYRNFFSFIFANYQLFFKLKTLPGLCSANVHTLPNVILAGNLGFDIQC